VSRVAAAVVVILVAGVGAGAWWLAGVPTGVTESPGDPASDYVDPSRPLAERLQQLELVIAREQEARMVLEDQLRALIDDIERIESGGQLLLAERTRQQQESQREARRNTSRSRDYVALMQDFQERRVKQLTQGGFSEGEAREILKRESAAQYEAMLAAHEAQRNGEDLDLTRSFGGAQDLLRAELGDDEYARYLRAQGQAAAIQVTQVMEGSPGSRAGLQPGDEIVSYNGDRVFTVSDLRSLTLQGTAGEDVVVEIDRDGVRMQLNLQRGPVGISGASANRRFGAWWSGT
jgi:C-terminal processing protease CtpA/Prc